MLMHAGIMYSYGVFFKYLVADFGWTRAATSGVYSLFMVSNGCFAIVIFGFAYGGEVPQMPALVGHFFGLRAVGALVGIVVFGATTGGAIGAWVGGRIFDVTQSYQLAFTIAAIASLSAVIIMLMLKKVKAVIPD